MGNKVIAAGHICLDITPVFPQTDACRNVGDLLVPGKLIQMGRANVHTGGSVANTGLALKLLGADVSLMGKVGQDSFGAMVQVLLDKYGVGGLLTDKLSETSYSVVLAMPGIDRIFLHNPGANDTFSNDDISDEHLQEAVLFHFGYPPLMRKMYENCGAELTRLFCRLKEKNIATSLDMAAIDPSSAAGQLDWEAILKRLLPYTDFFVPSIEELCFMINRKRYDTLTENGADFIKQLDIERDVAPLASRLIDMGCRVVMIKCGTRGIYLKTASKAVLSKIGSRLELDCALWCDKEMLQPCFKAERVLSATGAGDLSIAAFLQAVLEGGGPEEAVCLAAAEGACAVTTYDALGGLKPLDVLKKKISCGWDKLEVT